MHYKWFSRKPFTSGARFYKEILHPMLDYGGIGIQQKDIFPPEFLWQKVIFEFLVNLNILKGLLFFVIRPQGFEPAM